MCCHLLDSTCTTRRLFDIRLKLVPHISYGMARIAGKISKYGPYGVILCNSHHKKRSGIKERPYIAGPQTKTNVLVLLTFW